MNTDFTKTAINLIGPMDLDLTVVDDRLFTIVIDGGADHCLHFSPNLSVGDQDSTSQKLDCLLPADKDYSDYSKALSFIHDKTQIINCHGLYGGRLDHQLAIIGDSCRFLLKQKAKINFFQKKDIRLCILAPGKWILNHNGLFSLHSLYDQFIKIHGDIKYNLKEYTYIHSLTSHTISNVAFGQFFVICQSPVFLYFDKA